MKKGKGKKETEKGNQIPIFRKGDNPVKKLPANFLAVNHQQYT